MSVSGKVESEPYMAIAGFSRVQGRTNLHGVDYPTGNFIVFRVYQGRVLRETTSDHHMADHRLPIVELAMSEVQFAQLITNMNIGDGVPVTFKYRPEPGTKMIEVKMPDRAQATEEKFTADVRETSKDTLEAIKQAQRILNDILDGKTVNKTQVREALAAVDTADRELDRNMPFILQRADEAIGNRTIKAKAELDAFVGQTLARVGAKVLAEGGALEDQVRGHILIEDASGG